MVNGLLYFTFFMSQLITGSESESERKKKAEREIFIKGTYTYMKLTYLSTDGMILHVDC